jgi:L-alanine-DL-glutamate epimerase-like enolase superfamily enzyme
MDSVDGILLIDAGTIWYDKVVSPKNVSLPFAARAHWLEEPFVSGCPRCLQKLATQSGPVRLAGGEAATTHQAKNMIDYAGVGFIQIDAAHWWNHHRQRGRRLRAAQDVQFVNHTFTTHLALSASIQPYAGLKNQPLRISI